MVTKLTCNYTLGNETLVLQWHITSRCNQRCIHCYQDKYMSFDPKFEDMLNIVDQYKNLLLSIDRPGHINITGGEPLVHNDFFKLLELFKDNSSYFSYGILSNGTMIDSSNAKKLKGFNPSFVQLSIEGDKNTHDLIRGNGNLSKVLKGLKCLTKYKIKTLVSFTAFKDNYKTFPSVLKLCHKNKASKIWTDRLVPLGGAEDIKNKCLSPEETWEYFNIINNCKKHQGIMHRKRTKIETKRSLQFLSDGGMPYKCNAGKNLLTVMEDGLVYPCRRLPIAIGNINQSTLAEIYKSSPLLKEFKSKRSPPKGCEKCSYFCACGGGAKCLSYAFTGNLYSRDPGCPILWE
ncbi:UNVERIFIED_CONTAM: radical SAM protein with 4Fe4S-binding SPASM domain [Acetivibrio alkalicellulosi]